MSLVGRQTGSRAFTDTLSQDGARTTDLPSQVSGAAFSSTLNTDSPLAAASALTTITSSGVISFTSSGTVYTQATQSVIIITNSAQLSSVQSTISASNPLRATTSTTPATSSSTASSSKSSSKTNTLIPAIVAPVVVILLASLIAFWFLMRRRAQMAEREADKYEKRNPTKTSASMHSSTRNESSPPLNPRPGTAGGVAGANHFRARSSDGPARRPPPFANDTPIPPKEVWSPPRPHRPDSDEFSPHAIGIARSTPPMTPSEPAPRALDGSRPSPSFDSRRGLPTNPRSPTGPLPQRRPSRAQHVRSTTGEDIIDQYGGSLPRNRSYSSPTAHDAQQSPYNYNDMPRELPPPPSYTAAQATHRAASRTRAASPTSPAAELTEENMRIARLVIGSHSPFGVTRTSPGNRSVSDFDEQEGRRIARDDISEVSSLDD